MQLLQLRQSTSEWPKYEISTESYSSRSSLARLCASVCRRTVAAKALGQQAECTRSGIELDGSNIDFSISRNALDITICTM
jgi:hypothetical protein